MFIRTNDFICHCMQWWIKSLVQMLYKWYFPFIVISSISYLLQWANVEWWLFSQQSVSIGRKREVQWVNCLHQHEEGHLAIKFCTIITLYRTNGQWANQVDNGLTHLCNGLTQVQVIKLACVCVCVYGWSCNVNRDHTFSSRATTDSSSFLLISSYSSTVTATNSYYSQRYHYYSCYWF